MSGTIDCKAGFFQNDLVTPVVVGDLETAVAAAQANIAGVLAAETAAAASAAAAATSETNAGNSAAAAASSATGAASSATAAASDVATTSANATAAAASATSAGNSATAAGNSATTAASSVTNAATSATNAGNSATNAATSATNATASANAAATSAAAAAASASSSHIAFTGGTIDGVTIGGTTPSPASFSSVNGGQLAGFRNALMNGAMNVWQRGTSMAAAAGANTFAADRWYVYTGGSGGTITLAAANVTDASVLNAGTHTWLEVNQTAQPSGQAFLDINQKVEDAHTLANQTVTLSFWAKASASFTFTSFLGQHFGTGGSPSADVNTSVQTFTVTTTAQKFTATFSLPSISAKTFGTNGDSCLVLYTRLIGSLPATFSFYITGTQLEPGPVATPFEYRPPQVELALCQRYYALLDCSARFPATAGSQSADVSVAFPVPMRAAPTISTFTGPSSGNLATSGVFFVGSARAARFEIVSNAAGDTYSLAGVYAASAEL